MPAYSEKESVTSSEFPILIASKVESIPLEDFHGEPTYPPMSQWLLSLVLFLMCSSAVLVVFGIYLLFYCASQECDYDENVTLSVRGFILIVVAAFVAIAGAKLVMRLRGKLERHRKIDIIQPIVVV
jgi:hypothetical protein